MKSAKKKKSTHGGARPGAGKPKGLPPSGGRSPGSVNKITADIQHRLAEMKCDPIVGMARIAMNHRNEINLRFHAYAQLAKYIYAQRRSIEILPGKQHPTGAKLISYPDAVQTLMALEDELKGKK